MWTIFEHLNVTDKCSIQNPKMPRLEINDITVTQKVKATPIQKAIESINKTLLGLKVSMTALSTKKGRLTMTIIHSSIPLLLL